LVPERGFGGGQAEDGTFLRRDFQLIFRVYRAGGQSDEAEVGVGDTLQENDRAEGRTLNAEKTMLGFEPRQAMREFEDIVFRELYDAELFGADGGHSYLVCTGGSATPVISLLLIYRRV
jgi:hypothetical protein